MEFFKPGTYIDFMKYRKVAIGISSALVIGSVIALFVPGPKFGIDFAGGTEVQLHFRGRVASGEIREALGSFGYDRPDVVAVQGGAPNEYIVRVREVSALSQPQSQRIEQAVRRSVGEVEMLDWNVSPGGDKISMRFGGAVDEAAVQQALEGAGARVRTFNLFGSADEHRFEAHLIGVGDQVVEQLRQRFGERAPDSVERAEWVGPKAGEQLRDSAIKSILYTLALIMVYVAFRFDLRFAPGGVLALLHNVLITLGIYIVIGKEVNLTTVASLLTILGYSINDTIVIYDRIRENMGRRRDTSLRELINISTSETLSRTIITGGTVLIALSSFFVWGTPVIKDISFALVIGILIGTYSSIYIAAPLTEWLDRRFFRVTRRQPATA